MDILCPKVLRETMFYLALGFSIDNCKSKHILKHSLNISSKEIQLQFHIC